MQSVDPVLVQQLRCPEALKAGQSGKLDLVHGCWLVSKESGLKYPVVDGIPVMLLDVGFKWKATPIEKLPVPPDLR